MKVALVCPYDLGRPGGVQQQVTELARRLRAESHEVTVVAPGRGAGWTTAGRPLVVPGNASRAPIALAPSVVRRVRRAVESADVIHVHEPVMPMTSLAAMTAGRPKVATFHAAVPGWVRGIYRIARPALAPVMRSSVLTAVSSTAAGAIPAAWGPVDVIPNGIDVSAFAPPAVRIAGRVVFLGRDEPRKGLGVLLEAWPEVLRRVPDARLVVMGSTRPDSPEGVTFLGRVSEAEKRRQLAASSVFVAPNRGAESFGIVVAEGMAAGCAVVASDLAAFRDVGGEAIRYVPPGDRDGLASALVDLLGDVDGSRLLGDAGIARVRSFDWSTVLERYLDAYERAGSVS